MKFVFHSSNRPTISSIARRSVINTSHLSTENFVHGGQFDTPNDHREYPATPGTMWKRNSTKQKNTEETKQLTVRTPTNQSSEKLSTFIKSTGKRFCLLGEFLSKVFTDLKGNYILTISLSQGKVLCEYLIQAQATFSCCTSNETIVIRGLINVAKQKVGYVHSKNEKHSTLVC